MEQIQPPHGGIYQAPVLGTYPNLLSASDVHLQTRLAAIEQNLQFQLSRDMQAQNASLTDALEHIREEIQQGHAHQELAMQRIVDLANGFNERMCIAYDALKRELTELNHRLEAIEQVTEVPRDPPSLIALQSLDTKINTMITTQKQIEVELHKEKVQVGSTFVRSGTEAAPAPAYCSVGTGTDATPASVTSPCSCRGPTWFSDNIRDHETPFCVGSSTATIYTDTGVGSPPSSLQGGISERSFAIQTSSQLVSHFNAQTDDRPITQEQLRPAQWQNDSEYNTPLSSRESSPGITVNELRLLVHSIVVPPLKDGSQSTPCSAQAVNSWENRPSLIERNASTDSEATLSSIEASATSRSTSTSTAVGTSVHSAINCESSGVQMQHPASLSLSPLLSLPTLFESDSESMQHKTSSAAPSLSSPRSDDGMQKSPASPSPNAPSPRPSTTSSLYLPSATTPSPLLARLDNGAEDRGSPSMLFPISPSSSLDVISRIASRSPSRSVSRSSPPPAPSTPARRLHLRRASVHLVSQDPCTELRVSPEAVRSSSQDPPLDISSPPPVTPSVLFGAAATAPEDNTPPDDYVDESTVHYEPPARGLQSLYIALSGLDLERSPSVLSDLSSQGSMAGTSSPEVAGELEGRQTTQLEQGESIGIRSGRKRTRSAKAAYEPRSSRKRRKTDSELVPSGSRFNGKRRGQPRKHPVVMRGQATEALQVGYWEVVEGYTGPYAWPQRKGKAIQQGLSTIQCDKCDAWYHYDCVGVASSDPCVQEEDVEYICPPCIISKDTMSVYRKLRSIPDAGICGRPDCDVRSFTPERFVGRLFYQLHNPIKYTMYLVKWVGWPIEDASWEPLSVLQRDMDTETVNDFIRDFEREARLAGHPLRNEDAMITFSGFEEVAKRSLPPYVRP